MSGDLSVFLLLSLYLELFVCWVKLLYCQQKNMQMLDLYYIYTLVFWFGTHTFLLPCIDLKGWLMLLWQQTVFLVLWNITCRNNMVRCVWENRLSYMYKSCWFAAYIGLPLIWFYSSISFENEQQWQCLGIIRHAFCFPMLWITYKAFIVPKNSW